MGLEAGNIIPNSVGRMIVGSLITCLAFQNVTFTTSRVMLRLGARWYNTKITSLSGRRLYSVAPSVEENENVQSVDKLLNAIR